MIPISLTMRAFGPYKETEVIDFTKFYNNKLFLITGNTGSGKTMIFDAICYALFGDSSGVDRGTGFLKSQFADESVLCFVEFEFEHKGKIYKIKREPDQKKLSSRGNKITLHRNTAQLIIYDEIISGSTAVTGKVKEILGFDYAQFKQISMIAQGEFRKLVSATSKEREEIYGRIFDTVNIKSIQKKLSDRFSKVDKDISDSTKKIDGFLESIQSIKQISYKDMAMEEICKELGDEILKLNLKCKEFGEQKKDCNLKFEEFKSYFKKFEELCELKIKFGEIDVKKLKMEANFLEKVGKTFSLRDKQRYLDNLEVTYKSLVNEENNFKNRFEEIKGELIALEENSKHQDEINLKIRELSSKIIELEGLEKVIDEKFEYERKIEIENSNLKNLNLMKNEISKNILELEKQKNEILDFEIKNKDVGLRILNLKNQISYINKLRDYLLTYERDLEIYNYNFLEYNEIIISYENILKSYNEKKLDLIKSEEIYLRNQAGILAEKLVNGSPCMVCGSTDHPNKANLFDDSITEEYLKKLKLEVEKIEVERNRIHEKTVNFKTQFTTKRNDLEKIYKNLLEIDKDREFIKFSVLEKDEDLIFKFNSKLEGLEDECKINEEISNKIFNCKERIRNIEESLKENLIQKDNFDKDINKIEGNIHSINVILKEKNDKLLKFDIRSRDSFINLLHEIKVERENLIKLSDSIEENIKRFNDEKVELQTKINMKGSEVQKIKNEIETNKEEFLNSINEQGFSDFNEYVNSSLSEDEFKQRNDYLEEMRDEYKILKSQIESLKHIEEGELKTIDDFNLKFLEFKNEYDRLEKIEEEFSNNKAILENAFRNINSIHNDIKERDQYRTNLNELNKIASGENNQKISFERYILGIYFQEIISAANIRFSKLTNGRFLFKYLREDFDRRSQQGLGIKVFDNYTSDERDINTLSGGQSFEAALSLALGLSDVIQRYSGGISVDTLFIDEGFGSLDSNSIQNALECLIDSNDKARLIGIISHVHELKDFIQYKIEVLDSVNGSKIKVRV